MPRRVARALRLLLLLFGVAALVSLPLTHVYYVSARTAWPGPQNQIVADSGIVQIFVFNKGKELWSFDVLPPQDGGQRAM
ncbi:MAG: hypothetical protein ACR2L2_10850, partial [Acidobacteriota bacterium]